MLLEHFFRNEANSTFPFLFARFLINNQVKVKVLRVPYRKRVELLFEKDVIYCLVTKDHAVVGLVLVTEC